MTLRGKMDDFIKALSHALISTTPEARALAVACATDELKLFFKLMVAETIADSQKAQSVIVGPNGHSTKKVDG